MATMAVQNQFCQPMENVIWSSSLLPLLQLFAVLQIAKHNKQETRITITVIHFTSFLKDSKQKVKCI